MTSGACEQVRLPENSTFLKALLFGLLERAIRGDNAAARVVLEVADPVMDADDYVDELSAALESFYAPIVAEMESKRKSSEPSKNVE